MRRTAVVLVCLIVVSIAPAAHAAPANDDFVDAMDVASLPFTDAVDTSTATMEANESSPPCAPIRHTVWYRFSSAEDIDIVVNASASQTQAMLAIYRGTALETLEPHGCLDISGAGSQWKIAVRAVAGQTYHVQLGTPDAGGALHLSIDQAASISGTVTDDGGSPLAEMCVTAFDSQVRYASVALSDASGSFTVEGLSPDTYRLSLQDCGPHLYREEWYDDASNFFAAVPIPVTTGEHVTGITGSLARGAEIWGQIVDEATDVPLPFICVDVFDPNGEFLRNARTDADGEYVVGGLDAGTYLLQFIDCESENYVAEWYDDQPTQGTATPVTVADQARVVGVDAGLSLRPDIGDPGSIGGFVRNENGERLPSICVDIYTADHVFVAGAVTSDWGSFDVPDLPIGSYTVHFADCGGDGYLAEWFSDARGFEEATPVYVQGGRTTYANASMSRFSVSGSTFVGIVRSSRTEQTLSGVCVDALTTPARVVRSTVTDEDGSYVLTDVPAGDYRVRFTDCAEGTHRTEWFDDTYAFDDARVFYLGDPELITADAMLDIKRPDLALTGISVRSTTPDGGVPNTGREVTVEVTNVGEASGVQQTLTIHVCPKTTGDCTRTVRPVVVVQPGKSVQVQVVLDGLDGTIGDVVITARIDNEFDIDRSNDEASTEYYWVVGGTGHGVGLPA